MNIQNYKTAGKKDGHQKEIQQNYRKDRTDTEWKTQHLQTNNKRTVLNNIIRPTEYTTRQK